MRADPEDRARVELKLVPHTAVDCRDPPRSAVLRPLARRSIRSLRDLARMQRRLVVALVALACCEASVEWRDVNAKIKDRYLLRGISGKATAGRLHAIMGPSGSGKSRSAVCDVCCAFAFQERRGRVRSKEKAGRAQVRCCARLPDVAKRKWRCEGRCSRRGSASRRWTRRLCVRRTSFIRT